MKYLKFYVTCIYQLEMAKKTNEETTEFALKNITREMIINLNYSDNCQKKCKVS